MAFNIQPFSSGDDQKRAFKLFEKEMGVYWNSINRLRKI